MIQKLPLALPITWDSPFWPIMMGIEHERIHLETSSVLIRQLPIEKVQPHSLWPICTTYRRNVNEVPCNSLLPVEGKNFVFGKSRNSHLYGWDNEYGRHETEVKSFKASKFLVSNKEFYEFMQDGGYEKEEYWTPEGWKWKNYRQAAHPVFWVLDSNGVYKYRSMTHEIEMPWDWPVDVNYLEAKAFCNWKAKKTGLKIRLPTEDEWYVLRDSVFGEEFDQDNWKAAPGNVNFEYWASSSPIDMFITKEFADVMGNVWQWTETPTDGFEGFEVHPLYDDFSTPTFDTRHNLIKGGSWISTGNESIRDSRYAFRRHFFQHAGFRYVESEVEVVIKENPYEVEKDITRLVDFQYGPSYFNISNFDQQCAKLCLELVNSTQRPTERALHIGCGTGRFVFELAHQFKYVLGTDRSARIIQVAWRLAETGKVRYAITDEGEITDFCDIYLRDFDLDEVRSKVEFKQEDPCNPTDRNGTFDLVFVSNQLELLSNPICCLEKLEKLVNPNGLLIITSTCNLQESVTPRNQWLGGFKKSGENFRCLDGIAEVLKGKFRMLQSKISPMDVQYVIRHTKRKYDLSVTQFTVWEKL